MKIRKGLVSNSSSSCFIILNKTDNKLTFNDFFHDFPVALVNICNEAKKPLEVVLEESKDFEISPGENYINSSRLELRGNIITKDLREALNKTKYPWETIRFAWKEVYNEQESKW